MKQIAILDDKIWFPPIAQTNENGLLAAGGDLRIERLLLAYRKGIFPWFSASYPLWWCPDPRFVLFPDELAVSKSLKSVLKKNLFSFTRNKEFDKVILACKEIPRPGQDGTWINEELMQSFEQLHKMNIAQSFEAWKNGDLVGGLYGMKLGNIFFGESMFSREPNASKAAFAWAVSQMQMEGIVLVDCQVYTEHLESFGARFISRHHFCEILQNEIA